LYTGALKWPAANPTVRDAHCNIISRRPAAQSNDYFVINYSFCAFSVVYDNMVPKPMIAFVLICGGQLFWLNLERDWLTAAACENNDTI